DSTRSTGRARPPSGRRRLLSCSSEAERERLIQQFVEDLHFCRLREGPPLAARRKKKLAAFSAAAGRFLQFPIGDRRCNRPPAALVLPGITLAPFSAAAGRFFGSRLAIGAALECARAPASARQRAPTPYKPPRTL